MLASPKKALAMISSSFSMYVCVQYDRLQQHGYHALLSVCVQTCLLITILGLAHGKCGRHGRRMALGGRAGHLPSRFKEHSTSSGRRARSSPLGNDDDNWALVSDDSSLLGVAGMVAEWLSLGERLGFQSVSRIISFQLKLQLARGVLDSLDEDKWTSLGNEWERYCYEAQESSVVFPHDVRKSLRLIWGSALSFRTIACASKRVAVIFATLRTQYLEKSYTNQISALPMADHIPALANSCVVSNAVNEQKQKHPPPASNSHPPFCAAAPSNRALPTP